MIKADRLVKSAWVMVEIDRERCERVLMVQTYIAVDPREKDFDPVRYDAVVSVVRRVLAENTGIERASILSMHRDTGCTVLFRKPMDHLSDVGSPLA